MKTDPRLVRLRGALEAEEPGARGIERVARNPECLRLRALTIAGITPKTAATTIFGGQNNEGQSPFAIALGQRFEKLMLEHGAAKLFALYRKQNLLGLAESKIVDIPQMAPPVAGKQEQRLRAKRLRETHTARALRAKLNRDPSAPNIIIKPRLLITIVGVTHAIEPDYLVAGDSEPFYRAGELKSYPDRGGKTDAADIRSACRQAAVGTVALQQTLDSFGISGANSLAIPEADLMLRVTGFFLPTLRRMTIKGEVDSIVRAIAEAPTNLDELDSLLPADASLADPAVLSSIPNHYCPGCKEHCALWKNCREQARAEDQPIVLGDAIAEKLAAAGSLSRALDLMRGTAAPPRNDAEAALAEELRAAETLFRKAAGNG